MKRIMTFVAGALVTTGLVAAPVKSPVWELLYGNTVFGFAFFDVNNIDRDGDIAKGWLLIRTPTSIVQRLAREAKSLYKRAEKHKELSADDTDKLRKAVEKTVEGDQPTSRILVNCKTNQYSANDDGWEDIKPGSAEMALSYRLCGTGTLGH